MDTSAQAAAAEEAARLWQAGPASDLRKHVAASIGAHAANAYTAIETALERILIAADGRTIAGANYHRALLERAALDVPSARPAVITRKTFDLLDDLRGFRHVVRHAYAGFDPDQAVESIEGIGKIVAQVMQEVARFSAWSTKPAPKRAAKRRARRRG